MVRTSANNKVHLDALARQRLVRILVSIECGDSSIDDFELLVR